jgi:OOP family OmpA-OmpF porin
MAVHGWGKSRPIAPNTQPGGADDPEGRQKNRRVEITVKT